MLDPAPRRGPLTRSECWTSVLFLVVLVGLFTAEVIVDYTPAKLSALFFLVFWFPLLVLHEAGHAVVATLLGWYVARVVLGMGRTVAWFRAGTTLVEIRLFPIEGFVLPVPRNLRAPRLKSALIYFAGPGAQLLLLALIFVVVGPDMLLSQSDSIGLLAVQSLCVAILASAFFNLVPHMAASQNGMVPNDGLGIIRSFLLPTEYYAALVNMKVDEEPVEQYASEEQENSWSR
jgi:membrane-associated protease RseP (regulator of RpoE activity)